LGSYRGREEFFSAEFAQAVDELVVEFPVLDGKSASDLREFSTHSAGRSSIKPPGSRATTPSVCWTGVFS
jgi:hypothetical protein